MLFQNLWGFTEDLLLNVFIKAFKEEYTNNQFQSLISFIEL